MTTVNNQQATSCCGAAPATQLTDREEAVIVLAAAMALDNRDALRNAIIEAKQLGITNAEINVINQVVMGLQDCGCDGDCGDSALDATGQSGSSSCCR